MDFNSGLDSSTSSTSTNDTDEEIEDQIAANDPKTFVFNFKAEKWGLEFREFKGYLESKLEAFMKDADLQFLRSNVHFKRAKNKAVDDCLEKTCFKVDAECDKLIHTDKSIRLYDRVLSASLFFGNKWKPDEDYSSWLQKIHSAAGSRPNCDGEAAEAKTTILNGLPQEIQKMTRGKSGITMHSKSLKGWYHEQQILLFFMLPSLFDMLPVQIEHRFATKIHEIVNAEPKKNNLHEKLCEDIDTDEFCSEIDFYTRALGMCCVKYLCSEWRVPNPPHRFMIILAYILLECEYIVLGRNIIDWEMPNDLMTTNGLNKWRAHVKVLISFASLLTTLLTLLRLCEQFEQDWNKHFGVAISLLRNKIEKGDPGDEIDN